MSVAPRPHTTRSPGCASATPGRMSGSPGSRSFGGKLSITGTTSRWPASTTRLSRPRFVRATSVSPCRCTSRCGSVRRNASVMSVRCRSSSLTEYTRITCMHRSVSASCSPIPASTVSLSGSPARSITSCIVPPNACRALARSIRQHSTSAARMRAYAFQIHPRCAGQIPDACVQMKSARLKCMCVHILALGRAGTRSKGEAWAASSAQWRDSASSAS